MRAPAHDLLAPERGLFMMFILLYNCGHDTRRRRCGHVRTASGSVPPLRPRLIMGVAMPTWKQQNTQRNQPDPLNVVKAVVDILVLVLIVLGLVRLFT